MSLVIHLHYVIDNVVVVIDSITPWKNILCHLLLPLKLRSSSSSWTWRSQI